MKRNTVKTIAKKRQLLTADILGQLVRRHSTATVLFHHAVAERLGLGPTDHKCLDLLRERNAMTGSELASVTGLTSGAITGVVARLEAAGYLHREADPGDRRQQILRPALEKVKAIHGVFDPIRKELEAKLEAFDIAQLNTIAEFLVEAANCAHKHAALLRAHSRMLQPAHGSMHP